MTTRDISNSA